MLDQDLQVADHARSLHRRNPRTHAGLQVTGSKQVRLLDSNDDPYIHLTVGDGDLQDLVPLTEEAMKDSGPSLGLGGRLLMEAVTVG